jgi:hypothetical protein
MSENTQEEMLTLVPKKIAFVVDNEVIDVLYTDERLAAIFLSQPQILDITETAESLQAVVGFVYDESTGKYMPTSPDPSYVWNEEIKAWVPPADSSNPNWVAPVDGLTE